MKIHFCIYLIQFAIVLQSFAEAPVQGDRWIGLAVPSSIERERFRVKNELKLVKGFDVESVPGREDVIRALKLFLQKNKTAENKQIAETIKTGILPVNAKFAYVLMNDGRYDGGRVSECLFYIYYGLAGRPPGFGGNEDVVVVEIKKRK